MRTWLALLIAATFSYPLRSQEQTEKQQGWKAGFDLQTDYHYSIGTTPYTPRLTGNTYLTGRLYNKHWEAGLRLEELSHPLPGYEEQKGRGLANLYIKAQYKRFEATLGDVYEQFGSGLLLKAYEDRNLGIDNSIRGLRLQTTPFDGLTVKLVGGQQRLYFDRTGQIFNNERGFIWGADAELEMSRWIKPLQKNNSSLNWGWSWVGKHESAKEQIHRTIEGIRHRLNIPTDVCAWSTRIDFAHGNWNWHAAYAYKWEDPQAANGYTFHPGSVVMLTTGYAKRGWSLLVGLRRSENFDFRASRQAPPAGLRINHLLPFTQQESYTLAALYPYATRPEGEWAFQTEWNYRLPKGTWMGGKYGSKLRITASYVTELKKTPLDEQWSTGINHADAVGTKGYSASFFGLGQRLFHNVHIEYSRKWSTHYSLALSYLNQAYNQRLIEGHAEQGNTIRSHIFIYEGKHKLPKRSSLRTELQYFHSRQAEGDWVYGMVEYAPHPRLLFSASDQWNMGTTKQHYYMASLTGLLGSHRLQLSYGRTRQGINCSGGVCRMMPATQGLYLSYQVNL